MDVDGGSQSVLEGSLSKEEYDKLEISLKRKIETILEDHLQDFLTAKACFETTRTSLETRVSELEALLITAIQERDEFKTKWEEITVQFEDINERLSVNHAQLNNHRDDNQRWRDRTENELIEKHIKNPDEMKTFLHEKDNLIKQLGIEMDLKKFRVEKQLLQLKKEKDELQALLNSTKEAMNAFKAEFTSVKDAGTKANERAAKLEQDLASQETTLQDLRSKQMQQMAKPSTSGGEKSSSETPTANIKPLSGPTTSTSNQTQLVQAATVLPWRGTTFPSIRPMASQPHIIVIVLLLPRQSGSATSSQPVLVAPQQQVVHTSSMCEGLSSSPTSSHIDCRPASSCVALNLHQNAGLPVIIPPSFCRNVDEPSGAVASNQIEQGSSSIASGSGWGQPGCSTISASSQLPASSTTSVTTSVTPVLKRPAPSQDDADSKPYMPAPKRSRHLVSQGEGSGEVLLRADGLEVEKPGGLKICVPLRDQEDDIVVISDDDDLSDDGNLVVYSSHSLRCSENQVRLRAENQVRLRAMWDQEDDIVVISDDDDLSGDGAMNEGQELEEEGEEEARYSIEAYRRDGQDIASYEEGDGPDIDEGSATDQDNSEVNITVAGVAQVASEGMDDTRMDFSQLDEGTGRSVPTTPSRVSPQDPSGPEIRERSSQELSMSGSTGLVGPEESNTVPDAPLADQQEVLPEEGGVTSQGEITSSHPPGLSVLQPSSVADVELNQAEASNTGTRLSSVTAASSSRGNTARRRIRLGVKNSGVSSRGGPPGRSSAPTQPQLVTMVPLNLRGVTSEGEKTSSAPPGLSVLQPSSEADAELYEAEGREAEASTTGTRLSSVTAASSSRGNTARPRIRLDVKNSGVSSRGGPPGRSSAPTEPQLATMVPLNLRDNMFMPGIGSMRGIGSTRPERPSSGFRGRRMLPYRPAKFGPRF